MDKNEDYRCIDVYEAMRDAVPDGCNLMDVIRGAEVIIADAIARAKLGEKAEERAYEIIPCDIRELVEVMKRVYEDDK